MSLIKIFENIFDFVIFVPITSIKTNLSNPSLKTEEQEIEKTRILQNYYKNECKNNNSIILDNFEDVYGFLKCLNKNNEIDVLITGSFYLVSDFLKSIK
jgi:folylpolyglutamate synthase/dihydropteroate synthase